MRVRIVEVDGEAAIEIPQDVLNALSLKVGDTVDVHVEQRDSRPVLVCQAFYCPEERTVVEDRYGGGYSGAPYIAWPLPKAAIPPESQGGDIEAGCYWAEPRLAGKGETPEEALADLERKCQEFGFT